MIIFRDKYFAKKKERGADDDEEVISYKDLGKTTGLMAGGIGTAWGGSKLAQKAVDKAQEKAKDILTIKDEKLQKENDRLLRKLIDAARAENKDNPVNIKIMDHGSNSASLGIPLNKLDNIAKELSPEEREVLYKSGHIGKSILSVPNASVLAHEIGHNQATYEGGLKNIPGKLAHVAPIFSPSNTGDILAEMLTDGMKDGAAKKLTKGIYKNWGTMASAGYGNRSVYTDDEGKVKVDKKSLAKGVGLAALDVGAVPLMELAATKRGLNLLKKHGASEEYMKYAKDNLKKAWNTYGSVALKHTAKDVGGLTAGVGMGIARENTSPDDKNKLIKDEKGRLIVKDKETRERNDKANAYVYGLTPAMLSGVGILKNTKKFREVIDERIPEEAGFTKSQVSQPLTDAEEALLKKAKENAEKIRKKKFNRSVILTSALGAAGIGGAALYNRHMENKRKKLEQKEEAKQFKIHR